MPIEVIIFYAVLLDALAANAFAWLGKGNNWYRRNFSVIARYFPLSRGWTTYYLILVLWIGSILLRAGLL